MSAEGSLFRPRAYVVSEFLAHLRVQGDAAYPLDIIIKRLSHKFGVDRKFYLDMLKLLEDSGDVLAGRIGGVRRWTAL